MSDGFEIGSFSNGGGAGFWTAGAVDNNTATDNTQFGFRVNNRSGSTVSGNTASGNGTDNSVPAP